MKQTRTYLTTYSKIIKGLILALILNYGADAQNVSYNANSIPVNGNDNTVFGYYSFVSNISGGGNTAIGRGTLTANTTGASNTSLGMYANANNASGNNNTAVGAVAMVFNSSGSYNTAMGYEAAKNGTAGTYNVALGNASLYYNASGIGNTAVGSSAMYYYTGGNYNTALGYSSMMGANNLTNATAIGYNATVAASNTIQLGNGSVTAIYAGTGTTAKLIAGGLQITGGTIAAGKVLTSDGVGNATWQPAVNTSSLWDILGNAGTVDGTNFIGTTDNVALNFRVNNSKAGRLDASLSNSFYGVNAARFNSTGSGITALGALALLGNTTGTNNTGIGVSANVGSNNLTNATAIGYGAIVNASNTMQLGNSSVIEVYAGTGTNAKVIAGGLQITGGTLAAGRVLTSDAAGNATWQLPSGGGGGFFTNASVGLGNIINTNSGGVIIGTGITTAPNGYKLYVSDGILTEKVKVAIKNSTDWADYVFEKKYSLMPLPEVEAYVNKNKHLPGVQSADQLVKEGGIDVSQMLTKQMEKIEELTLYLIQLKKENDEIKAKLTALENEK